MMPFGFITKREHDEIVDGLRADLAKAEVRADRNAAAEVAANRTVGLLREDNAHLRAKLDRFTGERDRDARGRYQSTRPVGEMGEGGL